MMRFPSLSLNFNDSRKRLFITALTQLCSLRTTLRANLEKHFSDMRWIISILSAVTALGLVSNFSYSSKSFVTFVESW